MMKNMGVLHEGETAEKGEDWGLVKDHTLKTGDCINEALFYRLNQVGFLAIDTTAPVVHQRAHDKMFVISG